MSMNHDGWADTTVTAKASEQRHILNEVFTTDYGNRPSRWCI